MGCGCKKRKVSSKANGAVKPAVHKAGTSKTRVIKRIRRSVKK